MIFSSARSGARQGLVAGLWLGVLDGAHTLHRVPELAGPWIDRIGTLMVAMSLGAVLLAALGAVLGAVPGIARAGRNPREAPRRPRLIVSVAIAFAAGVAALIASGPGFEPATASETDERTNVLLISIDTLRSDHLGAYGNTPSPSPRLDDLARAGVVFANAYSSSSWTLPAHASLLTGLDPFAHGVLGEDDRLAPQFVTLTERLRDAGYWTGAWVGTPPFGFVGARYGLDQGFDLYRHEPHPDRFGGGLLARSLRQLWQGSVLGRMGAASHLADSVIAWLGGARRHPFFLFVHFYDVHSKFDGLPYEAPEPYRNRFCPEPIGSYDGCHGDLCASDRLHAMATGEAPSPAGSELDRMRCLYDGGIAFVDHEVGRILDELADAGLDEKTVIVVTSDHGEAFFEHGVPLHVTLHDEVLRIPLIVRMPGGAAGKRARGRVRLIDLAPTILDAVGIEAAQPIPGQGQSLLDVVLSWPAEPRAQPVLAAAYRSSSVALVEDGTKSIHNGEDRRRQGAPAIERYDLASDAGERWNRAAESGPDARDAALERLREASEAVHHEVVDRHSSGAVELSEEERQHLRALGYLDDD
jgi:arylsulfatase A-like enzyme